MGSGARVFSLVLIVGVTMMTMKVEGAALDGHLSWPWSPQHLTKRSTVQYCGKRLVEAVINLCSLRGRGLFPGSSQHRRSDPSVIAINGFGEDSQDWSEVPPNNTILGTQFNPLDTINWERDEDNSFHETDAWFYPKSQGHQRVRRNIGDECCKKPCTLNDMAKYCGSSSRAVRL